MQAYMRYLTMQDLSAFLDKSNFTSDLLSLIALEIASICSNDK